MSPVLTYKLTLNKLHCYRLDEEGGDEVFLTMNGEKIWPADHKYQEVTEGSVDIHHEVLAVMPDTLVTIELWDYDLLTPNDKLGEFNMLINERGGPFTTDLKVAPGEEAKYSLEWEVH